VPFPPYLSFVFVPPQFTCTEDDGTTLSDCDKYAPYVAGLNPAACDVYAGTWCPYSQNCTELVECVKDYTDCSAADGDTPSAGFNEYLLSSPNVNDTTSPKQCGELRAYFEFDPLFINDRQVCEDIGQVGTSAGRLFDGFSFVGTKGSKGDDSDDVELDEPDIRKFALKRRAARTSASGTCVSQLCSPPIILLSRA
jgi:hypothetical protein